MFHIYTQADLHLIKTYRIEQKVVSANNRFEEKLICLDVLNSIKRANYRCHYCNDQLKSASWQLDHFYSRYLGGKNIPENLAPSCKWCNQMKNALDGHSFLIKCKKIYMANLETEVPSFIKDQLITLENK